MTAVNNLMMLSLAVNDMPRSKSFYKDILGFDIKSDYKQDDKNWWISMSTSKDGATITLTTNFENMKPGTMKLYFATSDVNAAHKEITEKRVKADEVKDDLFGPGSGVKWFSLKDPDGNQVFLVQA